MIMILNGLRYEEIVVVQCTETIA